MGATTAERVALFSIHPEYANAILDGTKKIEFRRGGIAPDVTKVVVYATKPVGQIIGWFEVEGVVEGTPTGLWREFSQHGGIDRASYRKYFASTARAFGIRVRKPRRLKTPRNLNDIHEDLKAPQSFRYLPVEAVRSILAT